MDKENKMHLIINKTDKTFCFQDKFYGDLPSDSVVIKDYSKPDDINSYVVNDANDGIVVNNQVIKDARITEIDTRLDAIDKLSIRSLRAKSNGRGVAQDDTKLTELDDEALLLREERATLI